MPKISVIVPVYNTERYLKKCLDSIINQTFQDFEIIIVNDGSTDNSEEIIKEYKSTYSEKIRNYKKKNGGLSETRNYGVEQAHGEYISFIDADDYIDEKLFENLVPYIEQNIDLIKFKLVKVDEKYKEIERISGPIFEKTFGEVGFNKLYARDLLLEPSWLYLYNTNFFKRNKFEFANGLYHEDFGLTPIIIVKANTMVSVKIYGYYYVQANNSITRNTDYNKTIKCCYDLLKHYDNMIEQISKIKLQKNTINNIKQYYTNTVLLETKRLNEADLSNYIKQIKKRKMIRNINVKNVRQLLKKVILNINIKLYLKLK